MSKMPSKIRYSFSLEPKARLQTAHGVWGGVNSQGEIEMNFYYESEVLPPFVEQIVEPDGTLGHELIPPEDEELREVTRSIHTRVLLNYNTARGVLEWLEEQLDALEEEGRAMYDGPDSGVTQ
jgi:hypothetical protein